MKMKCTPEFEQNNGGAFHITYLGACFYRFLFPGNVTLQSCSRHGSAKNFAHKKRDVTETNPQKAFEDAVWHRFCAR